MGRFITYDVVPSITYCTNDIQFPNTATTVWTFTGKAIGAAAADRMVIVSTWVIKPGGTSRTWTVTIGGTAATEIAGTNASTSSGGTADAEIRMFSATVASGTTANIVVTTSGSTTGCGIGVWSAYNLASTTRVAATAAESVSLPLTLSITVPAYGVACGFSESGSVQTWTGLVEDFDSFIAGLKHSGASISNTVGGSPFAITVDGRIANSASFR